jgi:hypothetical protein
MTAASGGQSWASPVVSTASSSTSGTSHFNVYLGGQGCVTTTLPDNGVYGRSGHHYLCDQIGHKLDRNLIEYYDGTAMGRCQNCEEKINFVPPLGGTTVLRLHKALEVIAEGGDFSNEWLDVFRDIYDKVKEEAQAVRAAEALLDAAAEFLGERFGAKRDRS